LCFLDNFKQVREGKILKVKKGEEKLREGKILKVKKGEEKLREGKNREDWVSLIRIQN
jgi:hypothetical protein